MDHTRVCARERARGPLNAGVFHPRLQPCVRLIQTRACHLNHAGAVRYRRHGNNTKPPGYMKAIRDSETQRRTDQKQTKRSPGGPFDLSRRELSSAQLSFRISTQVSSTAKEERSLTVSETMEVGDDDVMTERSHLLQVSPGESRHVKYKLDTKSIQFNFIYIASITM